MPSPPRIGVLGGTFDPPHIGHLMAAVEVRSTLSLDRVLMMVAGDPWQKQGVRRLSPAIDRVAMVRASCAGIEGLEVDDQEVERGGPSYMVDTLAELHRRHPDAAFDLIVGADAATGLSTWHRPEQLAEMCRLVVVDREGDALAPVPVGFEVVRVAVPRLDVSSSDLRARIAAGRPVVPMLPAAVCDLIEGRRLYR